MLTLDNLKDETTSILSFIDQKWDRLTGNARSGHQDRLASWKALAATSIDGHLDDTDPDKPYILFLPKRNVRLTLSCHKLLKLQGVITMTVEPSIDRMRQKLAVDATG
jgi:hypothetical protein